jgi:hypothetical protein
MLEGLLGNSPKKVCFHTLKKLPADKAYIQPKKRGWLYGMEMDLYKSQKSDGVLVQK